jgi:hypothetical protein
MFGLGRLELLIVAAGAIVLFVWRLPEVVRALERGLRGGHSSRPSHQNLRMSHHWSEEPPSKYPRLVLTWLAVAIVMVVVVIYLLLPKIQ